VTNYQALEAHGGYTVAGLVSDGAHGRTLFLAKNQVVRATRVLYRSKKSGKRRPHPKRVEVTLTVGAPNYEERQRLRLEERFVREHLEHTPRTLFPFTCSR
jgi:hypothetical protein